VDGERIGMPEMLGFSQFLLVAGSATTTNLIGNFFKLMMEFPDQYARLQADPGLIDQAIEEVLRYDAPVHGLFRTNNAPVTLGDLDVPVDSKVCLMWGSANRDPAVFERPGEFDIGRDLQVLRKNMTFGQGLHKCLGAPLARLECKVAVQEFLKRVRSIEPNGEPVRWPYATLNGLDRLPIRFTV
jgi:cytochrome P450